MADLLFEIGCEELPAGYIDPALAFLSHNLPKTLADHQLTCSQIEVWGTPRRLVMSITGLLEKQADLVKEVLGPKVELAWNSEGLLTKVGEGFLHSRGLTASDAYRKQTAKGEVIAAKISENGKTAYDLLPGILERLIAEIPFPKRMRWDDSGVIFARPVRWLLCLLDGEVVPVSFGYVKAGNATRGHRFLADKSLIVGSTKDYLDKLATSWVMLDGERRKAFIREAALRLAKEQGGSLRQDEELLETVKNLVEYPFVLLGRFDSQFLQVPKEILISEMKEHQRYFAVEDKEGELLPFFVLVAGSQGNEPEKIARGHARVLKARFEDGAFYFHEDKKKLLEERREGLKNLLFQRELGSVWDKVERVVAFTRFLAHQLGVSKEAAQQANRVAQLCKADLQTGVVLEFPHLQGVMGRIYGKLSGEPEDVCRGIEEHYWPRFSNDNLPVTLAGTLVALADRVDTLVGIIGVGRLPKGSADPFQLRRIAIAIARILLEKGYSLSLEKLFSESFNSFSSLTLSKEETLKEVSHFMLGRVRGMLLEQALEQGEAEAAVVIDGVLAVGADDLVDTASRVKALVELRQKDEAEFALLCATLKRSGNIVQKASEEGIEGLNLAFDASLLVHPSEKALCKQLSEQKEGDYLQQLKQIADLKPYVDRFFEDVMVMVEDQELRLTRLRLLAQVTSLARKIADFTRM